MNMKHMNEIQIKVPDGEATLSDHLKPKWMITCLQKFSQLFTLK